MEEILESSMSVVRCFVLFLSRRFFFESLLLFFLYPIEDFVFITFFVVIIESP